MSESSSRHPDPVPSADPRVGAAHADRNLPRRYWRRLVGELRALVADSLGAWRSGGRPWFAVVACVLTAAVAALWREPHGRAVMMNMGDAYARQPLGAELARVPGSVFVPTFDLPWWGAVVQLAAVLGVAEILMGRRGLTVVGGLGQLASTMLARVMVTYGAAVPLGLLLSQAGVVDTGSSGITTAVGVWLLARRRAYATLSAVIVLLTVAAVVQPDIDGREHAIAMLVGLAIAAVQSGYEFWKRRLATVQAFSRLAPQLAEPLALADHTAVGVHDAVTSDRAVPMPSRSCNDVS
jgi:hypothetical protein